MKNYRPIWPQGIIYEHQLLKRSDDKQGMIYEHQLLKRLDDKELNRRYYSKIVLA
jgi:hypothetical protein